MEILSSIFFDEFDDDDSSPLDDTSYAEELQLQEALAASLYINSRPSSSTNNNHARASTSSSSSCEICTEDKPNSDMFRIQNCPHSFCHVCISKHIDYRLQQNMVHITCPDQECNKMIEPESLRSVLPQDALDRWEEAIIESTILASEKIHCPYDKCSEVLVIDEGGVVITETECPRCHRLFCAECRVPWHHGMECKEFKRLERSDKEKRKLRLLARENKWKKCPNCKVFVDKADGCIHITCRFI